MLLFIYFIYSFIDLLDRDNAVKHCYKLAANVIHIGFLASANPQLQSPIGWNTYGTRVHDRRQELQTVELFKMDSAATLKILLTLNKHDSL